MSKQLKFTAMAIIAVFILVLGWISFNPSTEKKNPEQPVMAPTTAPKPVKPAALTISAAASLKDALEEIKKIYQQENPKITLTLNLGSSGSLQQQIEQGAPVDIFISAAAKQMDALQTKGLLVDNTRGNLLENKVVLIASKDSANITDFQSLSEDKIKTVALGEPNSVPAGKYAKEVLTALKVWDKVEPKAVYAKDVRQVLTWVETGNAAAGIVYLTDAKVSDKVKIITIASETSHSPVVYPLAVLKNSKELEAAKDFATFLAGKKAAQVFEKYGFQVNTK